MAPGVDAVRVAVLVIVPSMIEVIRMSPSDTSVAERITVPFACRVIDQPRASCTAGSSAANRAVFTSRRSLERRAAEVALAKISDSS